MSIELLKERIASVNDILCALNLLVWDSRVMMPPGGAESRGRQIATLTRLARDILAGDATLSALETAERAARTLPEDGEEREALRQIRHAVDLHRRVPAALIERRAAVRAMANAAWIEARAKSDFALFKPLLAETISNARDYADALGWSAHPYDALIGLYEPGETYASLRALFGKLRAGLSPILAQAVARQKPERDILRRHFPVAAQLEAARAFSRRFGYDMERGRLDTTVHPFEISFTRGDVRITTRCNPDFLRPALFGAFHETGHGLYEQNVDPAFTRSVFTTDLAGLYAVGGASFGAHESQSRLWENHVGRSAAFWQLHFGELKGFFPDALGDVDAGEFHRAVTRVEPGPIRTDADELTYDFHIMLRVDFEAALMAGEIKVDDIPEAWNAAMEKELGVRVKNDAEGCLQDIHWSSGMIGSFCTYTVGNVMAAQLFAVGAQPGGAVAQALAQGDYAPLRDWLREKIWRHGRRFSRETLLKRATGRGLDPAPYLAYLSAKYDAVSA